MINALYKLGGKDYYEIKVATRKQYCTNTKMIIILNEHAAFGVSPKQHVLF